LAGLVACTSENRHDKHGWWGELALSSRWTYGNDGKLHHHGLEEIMSSVENSPSFREALGLDMSQAETVCQDLVDAVGQMRERGGR